MKRLPIVIIALALMAALATMGVAYGAWSQKVLVAGNVYTGTFGVTLTAGTATGPCTVEVGGAYPGSSLTVNMLAAVPGDVCTVPVTLSNIGSIPANLTYTPFSLTGVGWLDVAYPFNAASVGTGANNTLAGNLVLTVKNDTNQPRPSGEDGWSAIWTIDATQ